MLRLFMPQQEGRLRNEQLLPFYNDIDLIHMIDSLMPYLIFSLGYEYEPTTNT